MATRRTRRKATKTKTVSLRNFTGKVRMNPDKTVSIMGMGKKKKPAKKRRSSLRPKRRTTRRRR